MSSPVWILGVLAALVALSEWVARRGLLRHLGSALVVIVLASVATNLGVIPSVTEGSPVYDRIFDTLAPLAIFWLLLPVHLAAVARAGAPVLVLFLLGALGTMAGVVTGLWAVGGEAAFGSVRDVLGGMFVATYVGGSVNFNAVALEYGVVRDGGLYAGAAVVDSAATTLWMVATVLLPRLLAGRWRVRAGAAPAASGEIPASERGEGGGDRESVETFDLALLVGLGFASLWIADRASELARARLGVAVPSILLLTTIALVLAQIPAVQRLRGARVTGWIAVMFFLAAIGALCDVSALARLGALAPSLTGFVAILLAVHAAIVFGGAALLRVDPAVAAVASQANIGGSTSALALARSLGRDDLTLPAILVGSLGNALGTYLGFLTVAMLR